jgi:hypothetical protein
LHATRAPLDWSAHRSELLHPPPSPLPSRNLTALPLPRTPLTRNHASAPRARPPACCCSAAPARDTSSLSVLSSPLSLRTTSAAPHHALLFGACGEHPHAVWSASRALGAEAVQVPPNHVLHTCAARKGPRRVLQAGAVNIRHLHHPAHACMFPTPRPSRRPTTRTRAPKSSVVFQPLAAPSGASQ